MDERIIKSTSADQAEFSVRCSQFLNEEGAFKLGYVKHGAAALTLLRQMYRIKVFKYHLKKDKAGAMEFINSIDNLGAEIQFFLKGKDETPDPNFLGIPTFDKLDKQFDEVVAKYYTIEMECGL